MNNFNPFAQSAILSRLSNSLSNKNDSPITFGEKTAPGIQDTYLINRSENFPINIPPPPVFVPPTTTNAVQPSPPPASSPIPQSYPKPQPAPPPPAPAPPSKDTSVGEIKEGSRPKEETKEKEKNNFFSLSPTGYNSVGNSLNGAVGYANSGLSGHNYVQNLNGPVGYGSSNLGVGSGLRY